MCWKRLSGIVGVVRHRQNTNLSEERQEQTQSILSTNRSAELQVWLANCKDLPFFSYPAVRPLAAWRGKSTLDVTKGSIVHVPRLSAKSHLTVSV